MCKILHDTHPKYHTAATSSADLAFPRGYGGVSVDEPGEYSPERLDAEGQRGHIQEDHVLDLPGQDTSLDGSTNSNSLVRIDRTTRGTTKDVLNSLLNLKEEEA